MKGEAATATATSGVEDADIWTELRQNVSAGTGRVAGKQTGTGQAAVWRGAGDGRAEAGGPTGLAAGR